MRRKPALLLTIVLAGLAVPAFSNQSSRLRSLMQVKLDHSRQILSAVVTSNWIDLEQHTRELLRVAEDPAWSALTTPEYARYSTAFLRATQDLLEAAKERDLETASLAYVSLTVSCVQCHRHVGRMRLADSLPSRFTTPIRSD